MKPFLALLAALFCAVAGIAQAQGPAMQGLSALARIDPEATHIDAGPSATAITLGLSQPVPFRTFLLDHPARLVVDFRQVDFAPMTPAKMLETARTGSERAALPVADLRWGGFRPGWSRMVVELAGPAKILSAEELTAEDDPEIVIRLAPTTEADFSARTGVPSSALWDLPQPAKTDPPHRRQDGSRPLRVVLDPGHGGIDPGADEDGLQEKIVNLTFTRVLKEAMTRAGMQVTMTREEDVFVPLETRISVAHAVGADLFLSLHADTLAEPGMSGATVFLFDPKDADKATAELTARHDRDDLLAGVDLDGHDDAVAGVLMDLARTETRPRAVRLAQVLAGAIKAGHLEMNPHPVRKADFSVLKAADIPSALIELGFLSSREDRKRLLSPQWQRQMAQAITEGVETWAQADAAEARLLRQ